MAELDQALDALAAIRASIVDPAGLGEVIRSLTPEESQHLIAGLTILVRVDRGTGQEVVDWCDALAAKLRSLAD